MNTDPIERLTVKIAKNLVGKPFTWGEYDCNTIGAMFCDILFDTNMLDLMYKKYSTKEEAIEFAKTLDAIDTLKENGFVEVPNVDFYPGDLIIIKEGDWYAVHVYINNGDVLIADIERNIKTIPLKIMKNIDFIHMRKE